MPPTFATSRVWFPDVGQFPSANVIGFTNLGNITNSTETAAFVFRAPKDGDLDSVGFYLGTVTTPQDLEVSFRNVVESGGGAGYPDATADQYHVIASGSLVSAGWNTTGVMTNDGTGGGTKRTVAQGDLLAVVFRMTGSGNIMFRVATNDILVNFPYATIYNSSKLGRPFPLAIKYADGTYAELDPCTYPYIAGFTNGSFHTGTSPDEVGNRFIATETCEVDACWLKSNLTQNFKVVLYDSADNVVTETNEQDLDTVYVNSPLNQYLPFLDRVTLTAGEEYRVVLKPTTASASLAYFGFEVGSNAVLDAVQGGKELYMTERTDAGAWTDSDTKRIQMGIRMAIQTDPGTGGAFAHASFGM